MGRVRGSRARNDGEARGGAALEDGGGGMRGGTGHGTAVQGRCGAAYRTGGRSARWRQCAEKGGGVLSLFVAVVV